MNQLLETPTVDTAPTPPPDRVSRTQIALVAAGVLATGAIAFVATKGITGSGSTTSANPQGTTALTGTSPIGLAQNAALHGTFVVANTSGTGYTTYLDQTGTASAVTATSITVTSSDGYAKTYTVDSTSTVPSGLADGATVTVDATEAGVVTTATATG